MSVDCFGFSGGCFCDFDAAGCAASGLAVAGSASEGSAAAGSAAGGIINEFNYILTTS